MKWVADLWAYWKELCRPPIKPYLDDFTAAAHDEQLQAWEGRDRYDRIKRALENGNAINMRKNNPL